MVAFGQTRQPLLVEIPHPVDHGARRIAKESGHLFATQAAGHQRNAMEAMIVTCVLMAVDFLLQHSQAVLR